MTITCALSGIDIGQGPLSMQIDVAIRANQHDKSLEVLEEPICNSIKNRNVIEVTVDLSNAGEFRRFVIEPYLLGYTRNGELVIKGYKIDQVTLTDEIISTEITLNRGGVITQKEEKTGDIRTTRMSRIIRIDVLKNTHFKPREMGFDDDSDEALKVICS